MVIPDVIRYPEQGELARGPMEAHNTVMKPNQPLSEKLSETGGTPERGYDAWKRAKVEKGLEQSKDRGAMIPVSRILRDFGLER